MFTLYAKVHKPVCVPSTNTLVFFLHLGFICVAIREYSLVLLHSYFVLIFALDSDQLIEICFNFFFHGKYGQGLYCFKTLNQK